MNDLTLTLKEADFIAALTGLLYAEPGFSDVDASDMIHELAPKGYSRHAVAGLISSLTEKRVISTEDGGANGIDYDIIYLDREELHKDWAADNGLEFVNPYDIIKG